MRRGASAARRSWKSPGGETLRRKPARRRRPVHRGSRCGRWSFGAGRGPRRMDQREELSGEQRGDRGIHYGVVIDEQRERAEGEVHRRGGSARDEETPRERI